MVVFYVMKINDGTIRIDDVPEKWREKVRAEIEIQNMLEGE